ncbi:MAG: glycosyltransferase family 4 protein [Proteobacteria bacterium]|nr:glycosyltransferase family 4 protein [Pseudomonadota bacterium]
MNQTVVESRLIKKEFMMECISLQFASSVSDISALRFSKFVKTAGIALRLIKELATEKYEFVYFTLSPVGFAFYRDLLFVSIMKLFGVKILYHLHGKGIRKAAGSSLVKKQLYKFTFRNTFVIVLADSLGSDIDAVYSGTPFVVNNGIASTNISQQINIKDKSDVVDILYLSNLVRSKGILVFLDSLCILRERNVAFRANIVGNDGSINREELNKLIKEFTLEDTVYVPGPKYGVDKYNVLNTSDIFCLPTLNDAFPLVLLEAMQCGKPVVSTFEGAVPDIVDNGKTGLLVHQQNPEELADALQTLISDEKLRRKMGEEGRKKFKSLYTVERFEENMCNVFSCITDRREISKDC